MFPKMAKAHTWLIWEKGSFLTILFKDFTPGLSIDKFFVKLKCFFVKFFMRQ